MAAEAGWAGWGIHNGGSEAGTSAEPAGGAGQKGPSEGRYTLGGFRLGSFRHAPGARGDAAPGGSWNAVLGGLGGIAGWLLTRLRGEGRPRRQLAVVERITLAPRQSLALIEASGQRLLVATSADGTPAFYPLGSLEGQALTAGNPGRMEGRMPVPRVRGKRAPFEGRTLGRVSW